MEQELRFKLHTLVGNEMRADMYGAPHHIEAHKQAELELRNFLKENPSMMEHLEATEEHFLEQLYK